MKNLRQLARLPFQVVLEPVEPNSTRQRLLVIPSTARHLASIALVVGLMFLPTTGHAGTLASFSDSAGQHVFYTGNLDQHIHQLYWTPSGGWVNQDLTLDSIADTVAVAGATLAAFNDASGEHVFYLCQTVAAHDVCQLYFNGSWINQDLTTIGGGVQTNRNTLTAFNDGYGEHVFYIGSNNSHLYQLYIEPGGNWVNQDLTERAGANNVAQGPLASFTDAGGEHAVYGGSNGHTYQLFFNGHGWVNQDLTATAKTSMKDGGIALSALNDTYGEHIFYLGQNQHINQLDYHARWGNQDLTVASRATILPQSLSALNSSEDSAGTYAFYIGTNQHVYELYSKSKLLPIWGDLDLTGVSGTSALADANCSTITSFNNSYGRHAYYASNDGFVHQLYKASGSSVWSDAALPDSNSGSTLGCGLL